MTPLSISILPANFGALLNKMTAQAQAAKPERKRRKTILSDVERALALGKPMPELTFASEVNYTYNTHAAKLYGLWKSGDVDGLMAYPLNGKNTYARALAKYRDLLVMQLKKGSA